MKHTTFYGHKMTAKQKKLCEEAWWKVWDWHSEDTPEWDMSSRLEDAYEDEKDKSCVNWRDSEDWGLRDTLPRSEDFTTEGYTEEFTEWACSKIAQIVTEGATTISEVAERIRELYPVIRG